MWVMASIDILQSERKMRCIALIELADRALSLIRTKTVKKTRCNTLTEISDVLEFQLIGVLGFSRKEHVMHRARRLLSGFGVLLSLGLFATLGLSSHFRAEEVTVVVRTNGAVSFALSFVDPIETGIWFKQHRWTKENIALVVEAADRWLSVVTGVEGLNQEYTVHIDVRASRLGDTTGIAGVDTLEEVLPGRYMPLHAEIILDSDILMAGWDNHEERRLTVLHEFGHALGIGTAFYVFEDSGKFSPGDYPIPENSPNSSVRNWLTSAPEGSRGRAGLAYRQPHGVSAYRLVSGLELDFLPMDPYGTHPYYTTDDPNDPSGPDEERWILADGTAIIPVDEELMTFGSRLSPITIGILKDLGWKVDPTQAEPYSIDRP